MFLAKTVERLLKQKQGNTEIIVGLDGKWANPPLPVHEDVKVVYYAEPLGQRALTNQLCRLSKAKYVMKIDAHCDVDKGYDVKMMEKMEDDITMVPVMYNLHAFDWKCNDCDWTKYQGPTPKKCEKCGSQNVERDIIWARRKSRRSTSYRFDHTLHFQYFGSYKSKQPQTGLAETMSLQGSCFMLTRHKYWELNICDEEHGGWGQQGVEVALKTWLSGGRVMVNMDTWYAHMFRTQGGDFGFPYPLSGKEVQKARNYSRDMWFNNKFDKQIHPLAWLLEKFGPVDGWHVNFKDNEEEQAAKKKLEEINKTGEKFRKYQHPQPQSINTPSLEVSTPTKGILYYTDNKLKLGLAVAVQKQLKSIGLPITSVSLRPMDFGNNIHLAMSRGHLTMAKQILAGLRAMKEDIVFFTEHDVLYHPTHFDFTPERTDVYYYNTNVWRVRASDGHALWCDDLQQLSGLCAYRSLLIQHFEERVRRIEQEGYNSSMGFEPGTHGREERIDDYKAESYVSDKPNIDIRHEQNFTPSRWSKDEFRNKRYTFGWKESALADIPGWKLSNDALC